MYILVWTLQVFVCSKCTLSILYTNCGILVSIYHTRCTHCTCTPPTCAIYHVYIMRVIFSSPPTCKGPRGAASKRYGYATLFNTNCRLLSLQHQGGLQIEPQTQSPKVMYTLPYCVVCMYKLSIVETMKINKVKLHTGTQHNTTHTHTMHTQLTPC